MRVLVRVWSAPVVNGVLQIQGLSIRYSFYAGVSLEYYTFAKTAHEHSETRRHQGLATLKPKTSQRFSNNSLTSAKLRRYKSQVLKRQVLKCTTFQVDKTNARRGKLFNLSFLFYSRKRKKLSNSH